MIYLDNAATTAMDPRVLKKMLPWLTEHWGNPSSVHTAGREARNAVEKARKQASTVLNCEPREIYFTSGGSESDNWALRCLKLLEKKKHIVTTSIEHHAVLHTCALLEKQGIKVTYLPVDSEGRVSPEDVRKAVNGETALVSVMMANNEIGTLEPVREIAAIVHEAGALFHTDAVQAVGSIPVDVQEIGCDLLSLSGHKLHGPKGVGVLMIRKNVAISGLILGGEQERGLRAGTENVPAIVGLGEAMELAEKALPENMAHMTLLRDRLIHGLESKLSGVKLNGPREGRHPGNVNLLIEGVDGEALLTRLDLAGIEASGGSACTSGSVEPSHVLLAIGVPEEQAKSGLRFSLSGDTPEKDVEAVLEVLPEIVRDLRAMSL